MEDSSSMDLGEGASFRIIQVLTFIVHFGELDHKENWGPKN